MKQKWLTLVLLGGLSFVLTWLMTDGPGEAKDSESSLPTPPPRILQSAEMPPERSETRTFSVLHQSSDDYRIAWEQLPSRRLSKYERHRVQAEILDAWANVDLSAAIGAALAEPWDEGWSPLSTQAMVDRCDEVWRLIQSEHFGTLESKVLLDAWVEALGQKNADLLVGYLPQMNGIELRNTLQTMTRSVRNKEDATRIWQSLTERENLSSYDRRLLGQVAQNLCHFYQTDELREMMQDSASPAADFAAQALMAQLALSDRPFDLNSELAAAPEAIRSSMAASLLSNSIWAPESTRFSALDYLVTNGEWNHLEATQVSQRMQRMATEVGELKIADWVSELPPREETIEIFHRGVTPLIRKDREAAWQWMDGLAEEAWRDHAFAEYSQQMLQQFKDPDASASALEQIHDPVIKAAAMDWRANWERGRPQ
ncbi:hypothetical protein ACFQY0_00425 [Haloferula chungangensis]|uniref:HEAT repeat domain-containing protein n=1 Tax=Haloferula chungangensis TaxID=1048331 RepID=A0ABW2KZW0_9BACT